MTLFDSPICGHRKTDNKRVLQLVEDPETGHVVCFCLSCGETFLATWEAVQDKYFDIINRKVNNAG